MAAPGAGARASSVARASAICPDPPSGWTASPTNPDIWGPTQNPGQQTERLACEYTKDSKIASVVSSFALPTDPNPYFDFDYGCDAKDQVWSNSNRMYVITSRTHWAYTQFQDPSHQVADEDLAGFEAATRTLLKSSEGLGHVCKVKTTQTGVLSSFLFDFEYSELTPTVTIFGGVNSGIKGNRMIPAGSFTTRFPDDGSGTSSLASVVKVNAPPIAMTVVDKGQAHTVVIKISHGIDFFTKGYHQRLRVAVRVIRSNYSKCRAGSRGTLSISTQQYLASTVGPAKVQLSLCPAVFGQGDKKVDAFIYNA
jgi:hypothetical protein